MTVIESLASGTPVVGARIGGIPEQIAHGVTGLLFAPGDAAALAEQMQFLIDNREAAIAMGRAGRLQTETINGPGAHYEQTMAAYRTLRPVAAIEATTVGSIAST
jgi:glycosyltransferase involved in cell wall biosynthesis